MKPGDLIWVRLFKSDGSAYRWWQAQVESVTEECLVTYTPAGNKIFHNPDRFPKHIYYSKHDMRTFYWPGRRHDLLEVYSPDGRLHELYANITSPVEVGDNEVRFVDHELDVQMYVGDTPQIVDQDEFAEAASTYSYTDAFIRESYVVAEEVLELVASWQPLGPRVE